MKWKTLLCLIVLTSALSGRFTLIMVSIVLRDTVKRSVDL